MEFLTQTFVICVIIGAVFAQALDKKDFARFGPSLPLSRKDKAFFASRGVKGGLSRFSFAKKEIAEVLDKHVFDNWNTLRKYERGNYKIKEFAERDAVSFYHAHMICRALPDNYRMPYCDEPEEAMIAAMNHVSSAKKLTDVDIENYVNNVVFPTWCDALQQDLGKQGLQEVTKTYSKYETKPPVQVPITPDVENVATTAIDDANKGLQAAQGIKPQAHVATPKLALATKYGDIQGKTVQLPVKRKNGPYFTAENAESKLYFTCVKRIEPGTKSSKKASVAKTPSNSKPQTSASADAAIEEDDESDDSFDDDSFEEETKVANEKYEKLPLNGRIIDLPETDDEKRLRKQRLEELNKGT